LCADTTIEGSTAAGGRLAWSSDGQLLACGTQGAALLLDACDLSLIRKIEPEHDQVNCLEFGPGDFLLAVLSVGKVTLVDLRDGSEMDLRNWDTGGYRSCSAVGFSATGDRLIAVSQSGSIWLWTP
ncbi:WD40 repeat domain-containing protein, partial [Candidatus Fermentibacterales bacterium]|nr:WD40 repeat domain-containing protein [Candidatus Fermentibacterales bacterium]